MDFDVDLPDLTCPDLFLISVERVTFVYIANPLSLYDTTTKCRRKCNGTFSGFVFTVCQRETDVIFLIDLSSKDDDTYAAIVAFLRETVYGLPFKFGRTRVGILTYSDEVTITFHLNSNTEQGDVLDAIAFYRGEGGHTNTPEALRVGRETMLTSGNGDRSSVDNAVVLLTDGGSNINRQMTSQRARELRDTASTSVYVVAIGKPVDMTEVYDIAGGDNDKVYRMYDVNGATSAADWFLGQLC